MKLCIRTTEAENNKTMELSTLTIEKLISKLKDDNDPVIRGFMIILNNHLYGVDHPITQEHAKKLKEDTEKALKQ